MANGKKRVLTGVKPTGVPHIGNYLGAIRPAISLSRTMDSFLFIADLHALTIAPDPERLREESYCVAATYLAFGLDPEEATLYRQSDIPEITQLAWCLSCSLTLGYLNRAHSYKDAIEKGTKAEDINDGLYSYPVLMAADILAFDTDVVPVGKDQKQHLEIAQEAARRLNHTYGADLLKIPAAQIDESVMTVPGTDGKKMSKSYDNTIQLFVDDKKLKKTVKGIKTDSTEFGQPLDPNGDTVFALYSLIADPELVESLRRMYATGRKNPDGSNEEDNYFGWGTAKMALFDLLVETFAKERETYAKLMADRGYLDELLKKGAEKAREVAVPIVDRVFRGTGIR